MMIRFLILVFLLSGCAALPLESPNIPDPSSRSEPVMDDGYKEAVGVIHIHSSYSDGDLPIETIAKIAGRQNLDYLIMTDHNTLQPRREEKGGWYGPTLVLIDTEISTRKGHYLALNLKDEISKRQDPQWTIDQVAAQGGLGFIAHPYWNRSTWEDKEVKGFTGMEIYNAAHDITEHNPLHLGLWTIFTGSDFSIAKWLDRTGEPLALWDRYLNEGRKVVGIGGADAHGLNRLGLRLGPYATVFKLVRNHILYRGELTQQAIYEAIAAGHLFVAHDITANAKGFHFLVTQDKLVEGVMGDTVRFKTGLTLTAYLPSPGEIVLMRNGKRFAEAQGQHGQFEVNGPGIYRIEATKSGKPWIYSNPIYVVE